MYTFKFGKVLGGEELVNPGECADGYVQWIYKQDSNDTHVWNEFDQPAFGEILFDAGVRTVRDGDVGFYSNGAVVIN